MTQDIKRQRILDKIRKRQSKTTAMGCTEAEAFRGPGCGTPARCLWPDPERCRAANDGVYRGRGAVAVCHQSPSHPLLRGRHCGLLPHRAFLQPKTHGRDTHHLAHGYSFFGLPHDVEVAVYLTQVIMAAFDREARVFKRTPGYLELTRADKCEAFKSFRYGMAQRIRERLCELKAARERDLEATGRDLVRVVGAVVSQAFARAYPGIRTVGFQERPYDALAYAQGMDAGARVGLHPGVKGGVAPRQLRA